MCCAINECDNDSKKWCFLLKTDDYQKMCDTNKNVTKIDVIKRGFIVSKYVATKIACFVFCEILHHGDKNKTNVIHT